MTTCKLYERIVCNKHRKNCECCSGHYLIVNHYPSMSWFKFRNLTVIVSSVTNSIKEGVKKNGSHYCHCRRWNWKSLTEWVTRSPIELSWTANKQIERQRQSNQPPHWFWYLRRCVPRGSPGLTTLTSTSRSTVATEAPEPSSTPSNDDQQPRWRRTTSTIINNITNLPAEGSSSKASRDLKVPNYLLW